MLTCTRKLCFDAGHRVMGHENKCAHLHGHSYKVFLTAEADLAHEQTDAIGRVVDFGVIKSVYDPWIQEYWDHGFLLNEEDYQAVRLLGQFCPQDTGCANQKLFQFKGNPTAENIASYLLLNDYFVQALAPYGVKIVKVLVHETENCFAEASI